MKGIVCTIIVLGGMMLTMMSTATLGVVAKRRKAKVVRVRSESLPMNVMFVPTAP